MSVVPPPGSLTAGGDNREIHLAEPNEMPVIPPSPQVPSQYHENRIIFLVRDPTTLFAAWEVTEEALANAHARLDFNAAHALTLRVLTLTGDGQQHVMSEYDVGGSHSWYVYHDRPGSVCQAQLGMKCGEQFVVILESKPLRVPTGRESDSIDAEWATIEEVLERSRAGQFRGASSFL